MEEKKVSLANLCYLTADWAYNAATDEISHFKWMYECLWFDHIFLNNIYEDLTSQEYSP